MKHSNSILHQLLKFLPRYRFQQVVDRHNGDHRTRQLTCWDQFISLVFAQLSGRQSLRDLVTTFNSKSHHHYHLGTRQISRSTLSDANNSRPKAIYEEVFYYLLGKVRKRLSPSDASQMIRLIDSTTIDLNLAQFEWADFRSTKAGIKLHTVYDPYAQVPVFYEMTQAKASDCKTLARIPMLPNTTYVVDRAYNNYGWYYSLEQVNSVFIGRMKTSARYEVVKQNEAQGDGIVSDEVIRFTAEKAKKDCPIELRRIVFVREEDQKTLVFITNDHERTAAEIAALYKMRWQIELFFKWIKQNLKIKRFIGQSENAVAIQVLVAMITYLLLKLTQLGSFSKLSLQEIARLISVNLTSRRSLLDLLHPDPKPQIAPADIKQQVDFEF